VDEYIKAARIIRMLGWIVLVFVFFTSLPLIILGVEETDTIDNDSYYLVYIVFIMFISWVLYGLFAIYIGSMLNESASIWIKASSYLICASTFLEFPLGLIFGVPMLIYLLKAIKKERTTKKIQVPVGQPLSADVKNPVDETV
jgi:uncharacterized protein with PQ loop repeat